MPTHLVERNIDAMFRELTWVWEGGMKCNTFRKAVEALDLDATVATFSPSIVLRGPVRDEPPEGRQAVGGLFAIRSTGPQGSQRIRLGVADGEPGPHRLAGSPSDRFG